MAGGVVLMGVLLALLPLSAAMLLHGITQLVANGWRAWMWRHYVNWQIFRGFVFGALLTLTAFTIVQFVVSKPVAFILLGLTPFVSYAVPKRLALNVDHRGHPLLCGVVCTALQLLAGVSGPLMNVFYVQSALDRRGVVATKAISQTFGHFIKIIFFGGISAMAAGSVFAGLSMPLIVASVVFAFAGTSLSKRVLEKMTDTNFRLWTQWLVMIMGVIYLSAGLWMMTATSHM